SSAAAPETFPARAFAAASDSGSIAPPAGTPKDPRPKRGWPCSDVKRPGEITRNRGRPEGSGAAESALGAGSSPGFTASNATPSPAHRGAGGWARASKRRRDVRPIRRQPPGDVDG